MLLVFALLLLTVLFVFSQPPSPQRVMRSFYDSAQRAEDEMMDPLILAGEQVIPLVMSEIQNKGMKHRLYALLFIGNSQYAEGVPVLMRIVNDPEEEGAFRAAALDAIAMIDTARGSSLSMSFRESDGPLGMAARRILAGDLVKRRTYEQARRGHE